jgi:15-cis-phytoene synthase / lycopene beta-cyclase
VPGLARKLLISSLLSSPNAQLTLFPSVLFLLWSLSWQLLLGLPQSNTRLPIVLSTAYLWIVDTIALHRGTWSIGSGTKLGIYLWPGLEVEEAVFFLLTNTMVVFGLCAFDNAIAILDAFPDLFPTVSSLPSPKRLVEALLVPDSAYDSARLEGLRNALNVLSKKSRSFYLASGVFSRRLRIDLVILYAFCRIADDLVDQAGDAKDAGIWINHLSHFLKIAYSPRRAEKQYEAARAPFSPEARSVLVLLPIDRLPQQPLHTLLDGFRSDVKSMKDSRAESSSEPTPVRTERDLELYASRVAGTVAELCLHLVYFHDPGRSSNDRSVEKDCLEAGKRMGIALQYINIVRDVTTDAADGRCYIPAVWFKVPAPTSMQAFQAELMTHRIRILDMAFDLYVKNCKEIEKLPEYARGGIRVAVESYMEIGRVMREKIAKGQRLDMAGGGKEGRASVPRARRLWVGWTAMSGPRKP